MVITINQNEYEVHFGIKFIRELDQTYFVSRENIHFGAGRETTVPLLLNGDTVILSDFLYLGTCAEKKRPARADVDAYIEDHPDLERLFDEVCSELKNGNATRLKMRKVLHSLQNGEAQ